MPLSLSRRAFLRTAAAAAAGTATALRAAHASPPFLLPVLEPLREVGYAQVTITSPQHVAQVENARSILLGFSDDSLMKPFRMMAGQPAPGVEIGGWFEYLADYDYKTGDAGLSPGANFGQWMSALARMSAAEDYVGGNRSTRDELRDKVLRCTVLYGETIVPAYYRLTRLPAYSLDKYVCGLNDAHRLLGDPNAFAVLNKTTDAAVLALPGHAVDRDVPWLKNRDNSWNWDESATLPENLYVAYTLGAGPRYLAMAEQYLDDATFFDPLADGRNVLGKKHGYSYVNAMSSAVQAWLVTRSERHLRAAVHGFDMLQQQSYATGGWGPDETLVAPESDKLFASLTSTHNSFEAPCCAYAHMKLTRYLARITREGRYGDTAERVMYNTVLGAKPLLPDGHTYYFQDYNMQGARRGYSVHRWPCCSGTLPQVAADYGINSYFLEPGGFGLRGVQGAAPALPAVWVNLYIPSVLRWAHHAGSASTQLTLTQEHEYPYSGEIQLRIGASTPASFTVHLRIPAWASESRSIDPAGPSLRVNGKPAPVFIQQGFASITRQWVDGDTVELTLPMHLRLEPIPGSLTQAHPDTVALVRGPLVLFPLGDTPRKLHRQDLLAARQTGAREWTVSMRSGPIRFVPFTEVGDALYSTYLELA